MKDFWSGHAIGMLFTKHGVHLSAVRVAFQMVGANTDLL